MQSSGQLAYLVDAGVPTTNVVEGLAVRRINLRPLDGGVHVVHQRRHPSGRLRVLAEDTERLLERLWERPNLAGLIARQGRVAM